MENDRKDRLAKLAEKRAQRPRGRPKARLCTLTEVAEYLHVSRHTIYRLMASKSFPHLRIGYVLRFDLPEVLAWARDFTASGDKLTWQDDYPELPPADQQPPPKRGRTTRRIGPAEVPPPSN